MKLAMEPNIVVLRISGAFFFGAAAGVSAALDGIAQHPKAYVIDFSAVPMLDSTAATTIEGFVHKARASGAIVYVTCAASAIRRSLFTHGVRPPHVRFKASMACCQHRAVRNRAVYCGRVMKGGAVLCFRATATSCYTPQPSSTAVAWKRHRQEPMNPKLKIDFSPGAKGKN